MPTDGWYGPARNDIAASDGGSHTGPVTVGVLHTTEFIPGRYRPGSGTNYGNFGHASFPHFTCDVQNGVFVPYQHISLRRAARALRNRAGGVQTNREGCIQIEVNGRAAEPFTGNKIMVEGLRALMRWIEQETDIPRRGEVFHPYPARRGVSYGSEPYRMTNKEWESFAGWCGHQHVPENTHGDPGEIDIDLLLDGVNEAPPPLIVPQKEEDMRIVHAPGKATCVLLSTGKLVALKEGETAALQAAGVPVEGITSAEWTVLDALSKRL